MAGAYESCNHVIYTTLYKLEFANNKGWISPACTEILYTSGINLQGKMLSPVKYQIYL